MSSLRDIRRQIHSVENIKKITQAMERVAAVHLRRAQKKAEASRPYAAKIKEILDILVALGIENPLFKQKSIKKSAVVIITADKGLSGPFNSNILSAADHFLKKYDPQAIDLILVGKKGVEYYQRKQWKVASQIEEWGGKIPFDAIKAFSTQLVTSFLEGSYDEIWLIHTHYISIMKREVIVEKFLNITKDLSRKTPANLNYILEPDGNEILAQILPRYCLSVIQKALDESYAAELASRIVAMQAAGKNSEDLITQLILAKNKMRQRDITREMIEISAGAKG